MDNQAIHMENINPVHMRDGLEFHNISEEPFKIYGILREGDHYCRLPKRITEGIDSPIKWAAQGAAGGRVRFITDSPYVTVKLEWRELAAMSHMAHTGSSGCDIYTYVDGKEKFYKTCRPESAEHGFVSTCDFGDEERRIVNINLPLYNCIYEMYIGIKAGSYLAPAPDYKYEKPILYYGSSITQGGCASRPGMTYEAMVTRHFDINHINLGFSGSAKAEDEVIDYLLEHDMSVFVYDYDHNAPDPEYLEATHEKMFKRIREKHPTLPIIIMPAPLLTKSPEWQRRERIVKKTYDNAKALGDENVYYIPSCELMPDDDGTVDGCHPTDYGFVCMAKRLINELEGIIGNQASGKL